ncbi:restriction endonuclease subunit S [Methanolobus psychrotolerans]|uniref:restriction endonuclease subunit S n=1 Tax=Methanolobus psychrotolerans TaxID=1874706 RepID=UPI000B91ACA8|nr:restriction endonuclease subunit S [Methanolobus psychrotolerans]
MSVECAPCGIPAGYKQTEMGVIPEDWQLVPMGLLGSFTKGSGIRKDEASSGDIPCIRYGEIYTHHNDIIRFFNSWISKEVSTLSKKLKKGDILFAGSGETKEEIGKCVAFVDDREAYAGGDIVILTPTEGYSPFLAYLFNSPIIARQKASKGQGDAVVHISHKVLYSIKVPLPPTVAEQEAIAQALTNADALIESLEQLIAKKRQIKQGAMQELLTGKRWLPGFSGEWDVYNLRKFVKNFIVPMRDKPKRFTGDIPWCRIEDFEGTYLSGSKSNQCVDNETIHTMNLKVYPAGTLLVSCSADLGRCAIVSRPLISNQTFIGLEMNENVSSNLFFYYYMTSKADELNNFSSGTTISYLSREQFEELNVFVPFDKQEQTAIATILSDMDAEIAALEEKLEKSRMLKQGMMQELLTGRIRLV